MSGPEALRRALLALAAGALLGFLAPASAQVPEQVLKSFGNASQAGSRPVGVLVGTDGALYGTTSGGGIYSSGTVFRVNVDGSQYAVLHAFGVNTNDGATPQAGLVQGRDGMLYGTTFLGGTNGTGIVFKLATDGSAYTNLHTCGSRYSDAGAWPTALIQGADGALYGVAQQGGTNYAGVVFRLGTDGSAYEVLHNFGAEGPPDWLPDDGASPVALTQGADGGLYGVTQAGGSNSVGVVFRLGTNGSDFAVLYTFGSFTNDGATPVGLSQGSDGLLVGVTQSGGSYGNGVVFTLNTNGSHYGLGHEFTGLLDHTSGDGATPGAGLLRGADGSWYGTTLHGGTDNDDGTVFRMNADGSGYQVIRRFTFINSVFYDTFSTDGQQPGPLAQGPNGLLYGATAYGGTTGRGAYSNTGAGTLFALATNDSEYAVIYNFSTTGGDGQSPVGGLTLGRDGSFYGVTQSGGPAGQGSVFRINADGAGYRILYGFGLDPIDGYNPQAGLMQGADGMLYGTTSQGGYAGGVGVGIVFKVNPDGSDYTEVRSFGVYGADGLQPTSAPLQGHDGNLYGTTLQGGYWYGHNNFLGNVYTVGTNGLGYWDLHLFSTNYLEGHSPYSGLIQGSDGTLYGTTWGSAGSFGGSDCGTVFKLLTNGTGFQVLHNFMNDSVDGKCPYAGLMLGTDGFLYGTTQYGGTKNSGTVFKLSTSGASYQVIHHFGSVTNDGQSPTAPVIQGSDGYLYGTTPYGGAFGPTVGPYLGYGVAFKLGTDGSGYTVLHSFGGTPGDGRVPAGGLTQGRDGAFYGTTSAGGNLNAGTVFRLGPRPFAFTSFNRLPDKTVSLFLSGSSNTTCRIDASTDLVNWVTLATLSDTNGSVQFIDTTAPSFPSRFYRAFQGP
jgi:uncharacterized repeat protein (TIGR03803 family)